MQFISTSKISSNVIDSETNFLRAGVSSLVPIILACSQEGAQDTPADGTEHPRGQPGHRKV